MLHHYLLILRRNFRRRQFFSLLNIFGLALGLAGAIFIFLYVSNELCYDRIHPYFSQTYRIGSHFVNADGRGGRNPDAPGLWMSHLKNTRSEVIAGTRIAYIGYPTSLHHKAKDRIVLTEEIRWAEPGFDKVLWFDLKTGSREKMFEHHNSMILSETGARNLFGTSDPIGQIISVKHRFATNDQEIDVVVRGVYRDYPSNSHFKPNYILNVNSLRSIYPNFRHYMEGSTFGGQDNQLGFFENYVVLQPRADTQAITTTLQTLADQLSKSDSGFVANGWKIKAFMMPLAELHYDTEVPWEGNTKGNRQYLAIFSLIAVMTMLIACINYMNLATARSTKRAREVGLRKSLGSRRGEIARQFFLESFLTTCGALVLALGMVIALLKPFNALADKAFVIADLFDPIMLSITAVITGLMGLLSGIYPAVYLSGFRPAEVLKGQTATGRGAEWFKKGLVAAQYAVSLILIICTLVVMRQMAYLQHSKLNEQGDQLLSIRYGGIAPPDKFAAFKQAVMQDKDLQHVTIGNHMPRLNYFGDISFRLKFPEFGDQDINWNNLNVEYDFPKTYGLEIVAGRDFDGTNPSDSSAILLNEAAVKALNQPLDKVIGSHALDAFDPRNIPMRVIGVVKDFPFRSMHHAIEPLILELRPHFIDRIAYIKLPAGSYQEKLRFVEKTWKGLFPGAGFDYWFVSDEFDRMYIAERRMAGLAKVFAILAILVTALGVFGLAAYTAEQKTKEVGIRKVLGANVSRVIVMFLGIFIKIMLIAAVIALPIAYMAANYWLKNFAYRVPIGPWIFVGSFVGLLLLTLLTVGYEVWRAARANPVKSLRSE